MSIAYLPAIALAPNIIAVKPIAPDLIQTVYFSLSERSLKRSVK